MKRLAFLAAVALLCLLVAAVLASAAQVVRQAPTAARPPVITRPPVIQVTQAPDPLRAKIKEALTKGPHFADGEVLPVYKLQAVLPDKARDQALELANRTLAGLGGGKSFAAADLAADDDYLAARNDRNLKLQVYTRSGFVSLANQERVFRGKCAPLSNAQAADIARKFAADGRLVSLLANEKLTLAEVKHVHTQAVDKTGRRSEALLNNVVVIMGRELGGRPVIGPGGRLVIFLSGAGEVAGFQRNWREVEAAPVDSVKVRGIDFAADQVMKDLAQLYGRRLPSVQALQIRRVEAGYFADGKHQAQRFLQPAYAVHFEVKSEKLLQVAHVSIIPAGDRLLEPLHVSPPVVKTMARPAAAPAGVPDRD